MCELPKSQFFPSSVPMGTFHLQMSILSSQEAGEDQTGTHAAAPLSCSSALPIWLPSTGPQLDKQTKHPRVCQ